MGNGRRSTPAQHISSPSRKALICGPTGEHYIPKFARSKKKREKTKKRVGKSDPCECPPSAILNDEASVSHFGLLNYYLSNSGFFFVFIKFIIITL